MRIKSILLALATISTFSAGAASAAGTNLITNGDFETASQGQIGFQGRTATGWSANNGYTFIFNSGNVDSSGTTGSYGNLSLWGPNNGSANGLAASPAGGNFLAADGAYETQAVTQTVNGLVVGQQYKLGFYWAGAQQKNYDGATTEQWKVTFGNETQSTAVKQNADHGFTGWVHEEYTFTASSASQVLSFLAVGTPAGLPPFSLLDGVTMTAAVPEPATWGMLAAGLGLVAFARRKAKSQGKAA